MPIIVLTTDFGTRDHFVASMKGVILGIAPKTTIVDVSHEIKPYDVAQAAFVVWQVWNDFPQGTIHVVVVDPGVGTSRRIILGQYDKRLIVAPDNGVISWLHRSLQIEDMRSVENQDYFRPNPSSTFHGRDVLAPVAAHLAAGIKPSTMGPRTDRAEVLPLPVRPARTVGGFEGRVIHVDRFGTLITNITRQDLFTPAAQPRSWRVSVNNEAIGSIRDTFHDVPPQRVVALIGSGDLLEIAVNQGSALERFGPPEGIRVEVR